MKRTLGAWKENLPATLVGAKLVLSESDLETTLPVPLHGRVDQVFYAAGWLVPVDTKTRKAPRVYLKDVIQLSVYAFILGRVSAQMFGRSIPVASTGFMRCVNGKSVTYLPVKLLNSAQVIGLWNRYWELKNNGARAKPRPAADVSCRVCPKKMNCPKGRQVR
jgi:hypothetical protein